MRLSRFGAALSLSGLLAATGTVLAEDVYKWTDENGVAHYSDSPPEGKQFDKLNVRGSVTRSEEPAPEPVAPPPAEAAPAKPSNRSNCDVARKNIETFASNQNISMDRDGDGTPEPLDAETRAKELTRNQELAKLYCAD